MSRYKKIVQLKEDIASEKEFILINRNTLQNTQIV